MWGHLCRGAIRVQCLLDLPGPQVAIAPAHVSIPAMASHQSGQFIDRFRVILDAQIHHRISPSRLASPALY